MSDSQALLQSLRFDRETKPVSRRSWLPISVACAVLLPTLTAWATLRREPVREVEVRLVTVAAPTHTSSKVLEAAGYVVARRVATVSATVTGRVRDVLVREGQSVSTGEVMATLDGVDARAHYELTAAELAAVDSQLGNVQAQLREAQDNAARTVALLDRQLVPRAQHEQALAQRDALQAQLITAQRNRDVAQRRLQIAKLGVDATVVRAPFNGVVISVAAQPGEIISPLSSGGFTRSGIGTVVDMQSLEVEVDVSETQIERVRPGMAAEVVANAFPQQPLAGNVLAIIPSADRSKATMKVRVSLREAGDRVVPEMGVRVAFIEPPKDVTSSPAAPMRVPASAVLMREEGAHVFTVQDARAVRRAVKTGRRHGNEVEILQGLQAGMSLIVRPPVDVAEGTRIRISSSAAAS